MICMISQSIKHKCVAEYRNTGKMTKVLVKYLHRTLHTYVDTLDGKGYRFCLAVTFPESTSFRDSHLAFTSATGQLSDNVDILEVSTRSGGERKDKFFISWKILQRLSYLDSLHLLFHFLPLLPFFTIYMILRIFVKNKQATKTKRYICVCSYLASSDKEFDDSLLPQLGEWLHIIGSCQTH